MAKKGQGKSKLTPLEEQLRGLSPTEAEGNPDRDFNKTIKVNVTEETFELWEEWQKRVYKELGYENESKAFEFALVEATNTPKKSFE